MSKDNHLDLSKIAQKVMKNVRNLFKNNMTYHGKGKDIGRERRN